MFNYPSDYNFSAWDWIHEDFNGPSTIPRDPHLSYRAPSCFTKSKRYRGSDLQVVVLVVSQEQSSCYLH